MQALPAQPESLCIVEMGGVEKQDELGEKGTIGFLYLNIGLQVFFLIHQTDSMKFAFKSHPCKCAISNQKFNQAITHNPEGLK